MDWLARLRVLDAALADEAEKDMKRDGQRLRPGALENNDDWRGAP